VYQRPQVEAVVGWGCKLINLFLTKTLSGAASPAAAMWLSTNNPSLGFAAMQEHSIWQMIYYVLPPVLIMTALGFWLQE
jgi:hypothetical protein